MNPLVVTVRETGNVLRSFWRNLWGAFFTILLPVMLLILFGAINRDASVRLGPHGSRIAYTSFFTPGMLGMAVMASTFAGLVTSLAVMRDNGQLKRLRGTPLPPWAFFTGQIASRLVPVTIEAVLVLALARLLFQVSLPRSASAWGAIALVVVLGAATFSALGIAYTPPGGQRRRGAGADPGGFPAVAVPVGRLVPAGQPAALARLARRRLPARPHAGRHAAGADL
jgi:ABC-2 type transport system permease protein